MNQEEMNALSEKLPKTATIEEAKIEFKKKCISEIKEAIMGLNEIGIKCSFDESSLTIK